MATKEPKKEVTKEELEQQLGNCVYRESRLREKIAPDMKEIDSLQKQANQIVLEIDKLKKG